MRSTVFHSGAISVCNTIINIIPIIITNQINITTLPVSVTSQPQQLTQMPMIEMIMPSESIHISYHFPFQLGNIS